MTPAELKASIAAIPERPNARKTIPPELMDSMMAAYPVKSHRELAKLFDMSTDTLRRIYLEEKERRGAGRS